MVGKVRRPRRKKQVHFTDEWLRSLEYEPGPTIYYQDQVERRLFVSATLKSGKVWFLRLPGHNQVRIGTYPDMSLEEARRAATCPATLRKVEEAPIIRRTVLRSCGSTREADAFAMRAAEANRAYLTRLYEVHLERPRPS